MCDAVPTRNLQQYAYPVQYIPHTSIPSVHVEITCCGCNHNPGTTILLNIYSVKKNTKLSVRIGRPEVSTSPRYNSSPSTLAIHYSNREGERVCVHTFYAGLRNESSSVVTQRICDMRYILGLMCSIVCFDKCSISFN